MVAQFFPGSLKSETCSWMSCGITGDLTMATQVLGSSSPVRVEEGGQQAAQQQEAQEPAGPWWS